MSHVTQGNVPPPHFDVQTVNCDLLYSIQCHIFHTGWVEVLLVSLLFKMLSSILLEGYTELLSITKLPCAF